MLQSQRIARLDIFFCILFGLMGLIYLHEIGAPQPEIAELLPQPLPKLLPSENFDKIMSFMANQESLNPELEKDEIYVIIGKFNMFDVKTVKDAETLEKEANDKMKLAREAFGAERYQEARRLVNEVLAVMPSHLEGNALRQQIIEKLNPKPEPTPTPAAPAPTDPAALGLQY